MTFESAKKNFMDIKDEKIFAQDVLDFSDQLESSLNKHNSQIGEKFEFNFSNDQPFSMNSNDGSFQMDWQLQKSVSLPIKQIESKPKLKIPEKPRLSLQNASFNLPVDQRASIFSSSIISESTNITNSSTVSFTNGDQFNFNASFGRRTSIDFKMPRRQTVQQKQTDMFKVVEEFKEDDNGAGRQSNSSINDRASNIEGPLNTPREQTLKVKSRPGAQQKSPLSRGTKLSVSLAESNTKSSLMMTRDEQEKYQQKHVSAHAFDSSDAMKFDDDNDDCNADDDEFATTNRHVYVEDKKSMSELQSKNSPRQ